MSCAVKSISCDQFIDEVDVQFIGRSTIKIFQGAVELEIGLGDVVRLKKQHPCGSYEWEIVGLGADIGIKCLKCHHRVLLERRVFERRVKGIQKEKTKLNSQS